MLLIKDSLEARGQEGSRYEGEIQVDSLCILRAEQAEEGGIWQPVPRRDPWAGCAS